MANKEIVDKKLNELGYDKDMCIPFTRHSSFNGEPCDCCGSKELIHGEGRYIVFDEGGESKVEIFLCGKCESQLEEEGYRFDFI